MILALETSCDESAVALFDPSRGLLGEWVASQIALHGRYGGVVPELATREHLSNVPQLLHEALDRDAVARVESVAVTTGPGLAGCLALGIAAAKAVALALNRPIDGVNHLRAHAWSGFIPLHADDPAAFAERLRERLPHVGLLVSGGHTLLFVIDEDRRIRQLGGTIDDAAGEALDKGAKLLGLGYPGGPLVEREAAQGNAEAFAFPRALPGRQDLNFSFSGLKTSLRYRVAEIDPAELPARRADLCASYQAAVLDVLERKTRFALERIPARSLGLSGGVANNRGLRARLEDLAKQCGIPFMPALPQHTGDNAGMIAFAAWIDPAPVPEDRHGWSIDPSLPLERQPLADAPAA